MNHDKTRSLRLTTAAAAVAAIAGLIALGACASPPAPTTEMAVAEAAVTRAGSPSTIEAAPVQWRVAVDKLAAARAAVAAGDPERGRRLAEQATLDAQVAELHARSVRAAKAAQESADAARALQEEINRKAVR